ncbi:MAG: 4'-phosphopantetheinyl transferase family protein [bacterium]|jgi:phosphopantetheinyl transferase|nr:4'-phosphopantetheinyl transferase superfamily protein [Chitinophagaceae bacterium]
MPLVHTIRDTEMSLGLWEITEDPSFFEQAMSYRSVASNPGQQLQQLASRMVLKAMQPSFPFDQIQLNPAGKPFLPEGMTQFSMSHTRGFAAGIISDKTPVGIDIEWISPRVLKIEKKFLNHHEYALLASLSEQDRIVFASLFWSIKETVYKCWGDGGVDFSEQIKIQSFSLHHQGTAAIQFGQSDALHTVHYFREGDLWLSYMQAFLQ